MPIIGKHVKARHSVRKASNIERTHLHVLIKDKHPYNYQVDMQNDIEVEVARSLKRIEIEISDFQNQFKVFKDSDLNKITDTD